MDQNRFKHFCSSPVYYLFWITPWGNGGKRKQSHSADEVLHFNGAGFDTSLKFYNELGECVAEATPKQSFIIALLQTGQQGEAKKYLV